MAEYCFSTKCRFVRGLCWFVLSSATLDALRECGRRRRRRQVAMILRGVRQASAPGSLRAAPTQVFGCLLNGIQCKRLHHRAVCPRSSPTYPSGGPARRYARQGTPDWLHPASRRAEPDQVEATSISGRGRTRRRRRSRPCTARWLPGHDRSGRGGVHDDRRRVLGPCEDVERDAQRCQDDAGRQERALEPEGGGHLRRLCD